jgi:hypothetical protein
VVKQLTSRQRLINTLRGEAVDRVATFDVLHSRAFIEHLAGDTINPRNAEDLLCKAVRQVLDLVRHFAVPDKLEPWVISEDNGFVYRYEWWTGHVVSRPAFASTREIEYCVQRDIETIYNCIQKGKLCRIARQHVRLFDENFETFDELRSEYRRLIHKLDGPLMLPPEDVGAVGVATERYDESGWWYLWYDYPTTARRYLDALTEYQLAFIDAIADADLCPFTQISNPIGTRTGLLYSPDFIRREVIPREQKKVDRWKSHGYYVFSFMDGYKQPVVADFVAMGIDEIHPFEPYCGLDISTVRRQYPDLTIGQPIDCQNLLPFGSPSQIEEAVRRAIRDAGGTRIIMGSTSVIHSEVPIPNAMAMFETARNLALM